MEETPEMLLSIVQAVDNPRLRLCLDAGHSSAYSQIPVLEWLQTCAPCLSHLHIHNNDGTGDSHSPLYEGIIPVKELLSRAQRLFPGITATLELTQSLPSVRWLLEE